MYCLINIIIELLYRMHWVISPVQWHCRHINSPPLFVPATHLCCQHAIALSVQLVLFLLLGFSPGIFLFWQHICVASMPLHFQCNWFSFYFWAEAQKRKREEKKGGGLIIQCEVFIIRYYIEIFFFI